MINFSSYNAAEEAMIALKKDTPSNSYGIVEDTKNKVFKIVSIGRNIWTINVYYDYIDHNFTYDDRDHIGISIDKDDKPSLYIIEDGYKLVSEIKVVINAKINKD